MREEWRTIVGYKGLYEVSNLGRVRSIRTGARTFFGKILKARPYGASKRKMPPYWAVALSKNGKAKNFNVARLVARVFIGTRPKGHEIGHIDDDKKNNAATNLEYLTPTENKKKAWDSGAYWHKGTKNPLSNLTKRQVLKIWSIRNDGFSAHDVGAHFGISSVGVRLIWRKKTYVDLLEGEPRDPRTKLNRWSPRKAFP